jgi:D-tyrosyl-tRNA(Tyr) deacylase
MMHDIRLRFVVQRVKAVQVIANGQDRGMFELGLVVYAGIGNASSSGSAKKLSESEAEAEALSEFQSLQKLNPSLALAARKIVGLRTFSSEEKVHAAGSMEVSVAEVGGSIALVSQFTLWADCRKGTRPGFQSALEPVSAKKIYDVLEDAFRTEAAQANVPLVTGIFGANMEVRANNFGPVTYVIDIANGRVVEP